MRAFTEASIAMVYLLHTNELSLRHLLKHLDRKTTGPKGYCGEIGKMHESFKKMPIIDLKK